MWHRLFDGQQNWWRVARVVLATLFLAAAWGKGHKLATDSIGGNNLWDSRWFLVSLVVVEIGFALWLVFGLYPRWSWLATVCFFVAFALFAIFLTLRRESFCPCFGRAKFDPALVAFVDSLIVFAVALCPLPKSEEPSFTAAPWRLYCFGFVFVLVSVPALLNMVYYAHRGLVLELRVDRGLQKMMTHKLQDPSSEDILKLLNKSTGLQFTIDDRLRNRAPSYGYWSTGRAWGVMIGMAEKQALPARWDKTQNGYHLAAAAPWGDPSLAWLGSIFVLGAVCVGIGILFIAWPQRYHRLLKRLHLSTQTRKLRTA